MIKREIKTKEEAEQFAIEWQQWQSEQSLSYDELMEWGVFFEELGKRFNLLSEYTENGIL